MWWLWSSFSFGLKFFNEIFLWYLISCVEDARWGWFALLLLTLLLLLVSLWFLFIIIIYIFICILLFFNVFYKSFLTGFTRSNPSLSARSLFSSLYVVLWFLLLSVFLYILMKILNKVKTFSTLLYFPIDESSLALLVWKKTCSRMLYRFHLGGTLLSRFMMSLFRLRSPQLMRSFHRPPHLSTVWWAPWFCSDHLLPSREGWPHPLTSKGEWYKTAWWQSV